MSQVQSVVYREDTLGFLGQNGEIQVLFGKGRGIHNNIIRVYNEIDVRHATLADFDRIGVVYHKDYSVVELHQ